MIKVGLTGGIGTGKSTVSELFRREGIAIIDADLIAGSILEKYPNLIIQIKNTFGESFFDEKGILKRKELGNYIFKNETQRKRLEDILIPYIKKEINLEFENYYNKGEEICILDAPTLIENDMHKFMDKNILVWADENTQITRVKKRDKLTKQQVLDRISSQMSLNEKIKYVDFIIDNSKKIEDTKRKIEEIVLALKEFEG